MLRFNEAASRSSFSSRRRLISVINLSIFIGSCSTAACSANRLTATTLGRDVAIKVLPQALATDTDRLRRFETEARAIAALNHTNILSIHDIGTHDGTPYLVSELLEGQTLRQELGGGEAMC